MFFFRPPTLHAELYVMMEQHASDYWRAMSSDIKHYEAAPARHKRAAGDPRLRCYDIFVIEKQFFRMP